MMVMESLIRCHKLGFTINSFNVHISNLVHWSVHTLSILFLILSFLHLRKSKIVYSIWAWEEECCFWVTLNIFPSRVRPSTWNKLKIFFRESFACYLLPCHEIRSSLWKIRIFSSSLWTFAESTEVISFGTVLLHFYYKIINYLIK